MKMQNITTRAILGMGFVLVLGLLLMTFFVVRYFNSLVRDAFERHLKEITLISCEMHHARAAELCVENNMNFHRMTLDGLNDISDAGNMLAIDAYKYFSKNKDEKYIASEVRLPGQQRSIHAFAAARINNNCASCHTTFGVDTMLDRKNGELVGIFGVSTSLDHLYARERNFLMLGIPITLLFVGVLTFSLRGVVTKMQEVDKRTHMMIDAAPFSCNFWDENLNIVDCNYEALRVFGFRSKQDYLERFFDSSPEFQPDGWQSQEKVRAMVNYALDHGRVVLDWMHQLPSGDPLPTELTLVRVDMSSGKNVVIGYIRDLREARASETKIKEAEGRTQMMLDAAPLCSSFWDEDLHLIDCNMEAVRLFGLNSKQEYLDMFDDLSLEYQADGRLSREKFSEMLEFTLGYGRIVFDWMHRLPNGDPVPCEITLVNVQSEVSNIVVGFTRDLRELADRDAKLDEAEQMAFCDALTGLHNRRYFMKYATQEFLSPDNTRSIIGIIMFDIDRFKNVNDAYGHEAGDEALKLVAAAGQCVLRESDLFARYGGEEFIILARNLDLNYLAKQAERILCKIREIDFIYGGEKIPLRVSAGVAVRNDTAQTLETVIKQADIALYQAKANGRDRVGIYVG